MIKNGIQMPDEYRQMFEFDIDDEGIHLDDILANCERVLETSVRSGRISFTFHPSFRTLHDQVIHVLLIN